MRSLKEYAEEIRDNEGDPIGMSNLLMEMASDYGEANNNRIILEIRKADFWIANKNVEGEKAKSDTTLGMMFLRDGDGKELRTIELYTKGLEKMMSSARAYLQVQQSVLRNTL